jgi:16S rRNA processing protein RimM
MLLNVGRIIRAHGIRGEVVVDVRTDEPGERFATGSVLLTDPAARRPGLPETFTIEAVRPHHGRLLVAFDGVYDRTLAEGLAGVVLCVDSESLPPNLDPDEFNDHQLVGLTAVDESGKTLGEVVRVEHAPASDLLVIRLDGGRDALVPFVKAIVPEVDLVAGRVVLAPPEGLFDL